MGALGTIKKDMENYSNKVPGNINIHELQKITLISTAHLLRRVLSIEYVVTLFASQSLWFGLGCGERKSIAITLVYLTYQATIGLETYLRNADDALLQLVLQHETKKNLTPPKKKQRYSEENLRYKPR